jgi:diguanylate cyclase (GGDEF)-like protein/PAS domain S-box-containing protein
VDDKYAILKKIAHQKAKDEAARLGALGSFGMEKALIDLRLKAFEQEVIIEELRIERRKVEELASKYASILNQLPMGYVVCDSNAIITDANEQGFKNFSVHSLEKSVGRPLALSILFEDRTKFLTWFGRVSGGMTNNDCTFRTVGDGIISVKASLLPSGEIILVSQDVSKPQAELKLLHLIKNAVESSNDSVIITDANVKITYANNSFANVTGFTRQEVLGKNPSILKSGMYGQEFYEKMWHDITTNGYWKGQIADRNKDGKLSVHQTNISAVKENDKIINYIAIFSDVTEQNEMNEKILELSIYDTLTRLPNRLMFKNHIEDLCKSRFSTSDGFSLLFIDLDNFKYVNDTYGHSFGDELLVEVSRRLKRVVRKSDFVARFGGDEFLVLLEDELDTVSIQSVADSIISALREDVKLSIGQRVNIGSSIGIAVYPTDARNYEELVKYADIAMYKAKEDGKNRYFFYNEQMSAQSERISKLKNILPGAENCGEIYMKYQPLFCTKTLRAIGVEALARWNNVQFGEVPPFEFITLAEKTGHIRQLGSWLYKNACQEMRATGLYEAEFTELAINISGVQLKDGGFVENIINFTKDGGMDASNIVLEVTETMLIENLSTARYKLEMLREQGFRVALDDFGTGFSSLSYLQKLPIDIVKIDKSFIDNIHKDKKSMDIVETIIALSHDLGKSVVAEGVEEKLQAELLIAVECDILQGYLFSQPVKAKYLKHHIDAEKIFILN